jgi:hypothetical protein
MGDYQKRLLDSMKNAGVDEHALAKALKVSYQAVKKVTDGKTNAFTALNNAKAAQFLGVGSGFWLATGEPEPQAVQYSPQALDVARSLDAIADQDQRQKLYAVMMQSVQLAQAPKPAATEPPAPVRAPKKKPQRTR